MADPPTPHHPTRTRAPLCSCSAPPHPSPRPHTHAHMLKLLVPPPRHPPPLPFPRICTLIVLLAGTLPPLPPFSHPGCHCGWQEFLETVIPAAGGRVLIVNGPFRGIEGVLESVDFDSFLATVALRRPKNGTYLFVPRCFSGHCCVASQMLI